MLFVITAGDVGGIFFQWREAVEARALAEDNAKQARKQRDDARRLRMEAESNLKQAEAAREHGERMLYDRNVNAADAAIKAYDYSRAVALLENCRADLRDWEWRHLQRKLRLVSRTLEGLSLPGASVRFTPDGTKLIASSGGWLTKGPGELMFWAFPEGTRLETRPPHSASILNLAVHPQLPLLATAAGERGLSPPDNDKVVRHVARKRVQEPRPASASSERAGPIA